MKKKNFAGKYVSAFGAGTKMEDNIIARIDKQAEPMKKFILHRVKNSGRRIFVRPLAS